MRVVALAKTSPIGPSSRYRIYQYLPHLARAGMAVEVRPLFDARYFAIQERRGLPRLGAKVPYVLGRFAQRLRDLRRAEGAPLVVIQDQLFPYLPWALEQQWLPRGAWLLEFDDALYLTPLHRAKLARLAARASHVIVGNETLAAFARRHTARVSVVPTVVDVERCCPPRQRPARGPVSIGWIGLPGNLPALEALRGPLEIVARRHPIRIRVVCDGRPVLRGLPVEAVRWSPATEVAELQGFDIGLMPLQDDAWSRGKCGLKLLQYQACGVAACASPVGVNRELVEDGVSGFLPASGPEWVERLEWLCEDAALRRKLGDAGREHVVARFSLQAWAPRLAGLYRQVAEEGAHVA